MTEVSSFRRGQFAGIVRLIGRDNILLVNLLENYLKFWMGYLFVKALQRVKRAFSGVRWFSFSSKIAFGEQYVSYLVHTHNMTQEQQHF